MKPDYRDKVDGKSGVPPYWDASGMPFEGTRAKLTVMWLESQIKIIFCQACWQTFVVVSEFDGDPPFHNRGDGKVCIGNTMLHLDPLNFYDDLCLIQADYAARHALRTHSRFWCRETAGKWRIDSEKSRR